MVCATAPLSAAAFGRIFIRSADPPRQWAVPALGSPPIALVLGRRQRLGILGMGARTVVEPYWNPAIGLHGANNSTKPGAILIVVIHEALLQTSPRCEQQADIAHVRRRRFILCWCRLLRGGIGVDSRHCFGCHSSQSTLKARITLCHDQGHLFCIVAWTQWKVTLRVFAQPLIPLCMQRAEGLVIKFIPRIIHT